MRIAHEEGAVAIAHGCTGKGNDQVRFESSIHALDPSLKVVAPWREWDLKSREDCIAYAQAHNIPISQTLKRFTAATRISGMSVTRAAIWKIRE